MGTGNFYNNNASSVFVVEDDTEGNSYLWDMKLENVKEWLIEKDYDEEKGWEENGLRSFPGRYIASKTLRKDYCGLEVGVTIKLILRSGYYEHANVDWELEWEIDEVYDLRPELEEIIYRLNLYDLNEGMVKIQSKNIQKFFEKTETVLIEETEKILKKITTPIGVVARASNGETFYEKKNRK